MKPMRCNSPRSLVLALTVVGLSGCATTPEVDPVAEQLGTQEQQLRSLNSQVSQLQAAIDSIGSAGLGTSLTGLEEDIRQLRGEVEQLQFELRDMRQRRATVGGAGANAGDSAVPIPVPRQTVSNSNRATDDDQSAYLSAFGKLKSGAYGDAVSAFAGFLDKYPSSAYAPNAQYWIGEAHYVQRNWDEAWTAFEQVATRYPDSLKAADARLKQGLIRIDQGRMSDARSILQEVTAQHAGSSAARLATERLQRMGGG